MASFFISTPNWVEATRAHDNTYFQLVEYFNKQPIRDIMLHLKIALAIRLPCNVVHSEHHTYVTFSLHNTGKTSYTRTFERIYISIIRTESILSVILYVRNSN